MKTYYIEFERQGWTLAVVKVEAETYEEAELKAYKALHMNDDIGEISEDEALNRLQSGDIDYMIDEDGREVDLEDLEDEEDEQTSIYRIYAQDESGFENTWDETNYEEALAAAVNMWQDGDGGYSRVSIHELANAEDDISKENQIWYADHHM